MIVVSSYNGSFHLKNLIQAMESYGTSGHKVLIVDTGTTDLLSRKYLEQLSSYSGPFELQIDKAKYGGYEAGALIHAIKEYPEEDNFLFIHDSVIPTSDQWVKQFEEKKIGDVKVVPWVTFHPCLFCIGQLHRDYISSICGDLNDVPDCGFFGSIFYGDGPLLRELEREGYLETRATCKLHSESWERVWPILFHKKGAKMSEVIHGYIPNKIHYGHYPNMRKTFGGRF